MAATLPPHATVPAHELNLQNRSTKLPPLRSNAGGTVDPASVGWMKPTANDTPLDEMHRRFEQDGYLWIKGLIPRDVILDMREHYFTHMSPTHILQPGTSPRDGIFNTHEDPLAHVGVGAKSSPTADDALQRLVDVHVTPYYLRFLETPALRGFVRRFMGWEAAGEVLLRRTMLRHSVPGGISTGIHYDKLFLRAGRAGFLTAWVPIGDTSASGGGLTYLEKSSALGQEIEAAFAERAKVLTPEQRISAFNAHMGPAGTLSDSADDFISPAGEGQGHRWLVADYEVGDVVFHDPYIIHCAAKNEDPQGRIRLSTDLRFYEKGAEMDERWMKVWTPGDGL